MGKGIYKVYLCDVLGCVPRSAILNINVTLQSFFEKIVATPGSGFQSALVHWLAYQPTPESHELLLYFVPDRSLSVAKEAGGPNGSSGDGFTWWRNSVGAVSEVYTSNISDPDILPLVGFHELMHNKLRLLGALLHPKGGLAADPVAGRTPSASNVSDMAAALKRAALHSGPRVCSIMANGRTDSLSRYYQI